jgi:ferritin-like metal-binding protein YciE
MMQLFDKGVQVRMGQAHVKRWARSRSSSSREWRLGLTAYRARAQGTKTNLERRSMTERTIQDQIVKYLGDVHAIEQQALPQVKAAPKIAGDPTIADAFERHIGETEKHEQRVQERLEALGGSPNKLKVIAGRVSGPAFVLFAKSQPDPPGKLVTHAYSYEHMELAAYELLSRVAMRGHDEETAALAQDIAEQERAMAGRLSDNWDRAVDASIAAGGEGDLGKRLNKYLADAHAIEAQALQMLKKAIESASCRSPHPGDGGCSAPG